MRVGPHGLDGEVGRDVGVHQGEERQEHEAELRERRRLGHGHQARIAHVRAPRRQRRLQQRGGKRQDERKMSELDDHGGALPPVARVGWVKRSADPTQPEA